MNIQNALALFRTFFADRADDVPLSWEEFDLWLTVEMQRSLHLTDAYLLLYNQDPEADPKTLFIDLLVGSGRFSKANGFVKYRIRYNDAVDC